MLSIDGSGENEQLQNIDEFFKDNLKYISDSLLSVGAKIEVINTILMSKLMFYFSNITFSEKRLQDMESLIVIAVRQWLRLNKSLTGAFMFTPKKLGGVGTLKPSTMYKAKKISFIISVLNSDNQNVRILARKSLELHMSKRKVPSVEEEEDNFLGYEVNDDYKVKPRTKSCWGKSQWIELNLLCARENIQLVKRRGDYAALIPTDREICIHNSIPKIIYKMIKHVNMGKGLEHWKSLTSQGRLCREANIDNSVSHSFLRNFKLTDSVSQFVYEGRLQLLECNSLLTVYYPDSVSKSCKNCNHPTQTASHVLNGCGEFQENYTSRLNRICDIIYENLKKLNYLSIQVNY